MEEKFNEYLKSIGITSKSLCDRIQTIYRIYSEVICPDQIEDIFVSEYFKEDGSREYESLWFFTSKYCMEAKQFTMKEDFDIEPITKKISYWKVQSENYDFKEAKETSRLYLEFIIDLASGITSRLKAAKGNCDFLKELIFKYIRPNLM